MFDSPNHASNFHQKKGGHTLPMLENTLQTKATKTPALSFIFVFSALIEGLGRIMEEGPYLHCVLRVKVKPQCIALQDF